MNSKMTIKVEFLAGTSIENALKEAKIKAAEFNVAYIKFDFNGTPFSIGREADLHKALSEWQKGDKKYGICAA